jgi:ElaB/YqjD/DUF883 family membrane-anchored ribosome-binding protein
MKSSGKENPNSIDFLKYALNRSDEKLANSLNKIDFEKEPGHVLSQLRDTYFSKSHQYADITKDVVKDLAKLFRKNPYKTVTSKNQILIFHAKDRRC